MTHVILEKLTMLSSLWVVMSGKAGGLDSCGKCNEGTTDGVASRNGTSMADAIPRDEFCCQLYRYESYMRRELEGNIFSVCRGDVAKLLATFAMS